MRREWWHLAGLVVVAALGCIGVLVAVKPGVWQSFTLGLIAASGFWLVVGVVRETTGASSRLMGAEAEVWTSRELRRLIQDGWYTLDHLPIEHSDADHVIVGTSGVWVIETKWSHDWSGAWATGCLVRAAEAARAGAKRVRYVLRENAGVSLSVRSLIVVWGRNKKGLPTAASGVPVIHGSKLPAWLKTIASEPPSLADHDVELARKALNDYIEMRDSHRRENQHAPAIVTDGPLRLGAQLVIGVCAGLVALLAISAAGSHLGLSGLVGAVAVLTLAAEVSRRLVRTDYVRVGSIGFAAGTAGLCVLLLAVVAQAYLVG